MLTYEDVINEENSIRGRVDCTAESAVAFFLARHLAERPNATESAIAVRCQLKSVERLLKNGFVGDALRAAHAAVRASARPSSDVTTDENAAVWVESCDDAAVESANLVASILCTDFLEAHRLACAVRSTTLGEVQEAGCVKVHQESSGLKAQLFTPLSTFRSCVCLIRTRSQDASGA